MILITPIIIITREKTRIILKMNDGSTLSLGSQTKIVINQSIYDPGKKTRSSFMTMTLGKARFWVKKLTSYKHSKFKLKTKTAVVGVRGSDFFIEATENYTRVNTFADTRLEVVGLFARCEKYDDVVECEVEQYLLNEFEQVVIEKHDHVLESDKLSPKDKEQIQNEFPNPPPETGKSDEETVTSSSGESPGESPSGSERAATEKHEPVSQPGKLLSQDIKQDKKYKTEVPPGADKSFRTVEMLISVENKEITEPDFEFAEPELSKKSDMLEVEFEISENINEPADPPVSPPDYPTEPE